MPFKKTETASNGVKFETAWMTWESLVKSSLNPTLNISTIAAKIILIKMLVVVTTTTENFATIGWPDPSSLLTRTLHQPIRNKFVVNINMCFLVLKTWYASNESRIVIVASHRTKIQLKLYEFIPCSSWYPQHKTNIPVPIIHAVISLRMWAFVKTEVRYRSRECCHLYQIERESNATVGLERRSDMRTRLWLYHTSKLHYQQTLRNHRWIII